MQAENCRKAKPINRGLLLRPRCKKQLDFAVINTEYVRDFPCIYRAMRLIKIIIRCTVNVRVAEHQGYTEVVRLQSKRDASCNYVQQNIQHVTSVQFFCDLETKHVKNKLQKIITFLVFLVFNSSHLNTNFVTTLLPHC